MNRQTFFTFGGALLASTALTSGFAMAGTVGYGTASGSNNSTGAGFTTSAVKIANTLFSTTAATADAVVVGGVHSFGVNFCNVCSVPFGTIFNVDVTVTGAAPVQASITALRTFLLNRTGAGSFISTLSGSGAAGENCTAAAAIGQTVFVSGCGATAGANAAVGAILFSGIQFQNANTLATATNSITLSGRVYNTSGATFDTFSGAIITAAAPVAASVTAGGNVVISAISTPNAFTYLQDTQAGGSNSIFSLTIATVSLSAVTGVKVATLAADIALNAAVSSVNIAVTSGALQAAGSHAALYSNGGFVSTLTTAAFTSSNTVTFTINTTSTTDQQYQVRVLYDGTSQIAAAAATTGGVTVKFAIATADNQAVGSVTGGTAGLTRGGFNGELNGLYSTAISKLTTPAYNSYVRIHNNGAVSGIATVTLVHDATGVAIGSFSTTTIAAGATLQLSAADLETGAGVTTSAIELYTVKITGPFVGYVQHVVYNPTTGQINDLSSFRNAGATVGNP